MSLMDGSAWERDFGDVDHLAKKKPSKDVDMVNKPPHYARLSPEPIEVIESWNLDFFSGQVIRYLSRAGHKWDTLEDLKKALWYLDRKIKNLEKQRREGLGNQASG